MNDIPNDPLSEFSIAVFTINGLLMRSGEEVTKPLGHSSARWQVLGRAGHKPQTVARMARDIGNSRQSVQRIAHALVREGLATYIPDTSDKRAPLLQLTPRGSQILNTIHEKDAQWSAELMTKLDAAKLTKATQLLAEISSELGQYLMIKGEK